MTARTPETNSNPRQARNAIGVALVMFGAALVTDVYAFYLSFQNGNWQGFAASGLLLVFAGVAGGSAVLARRGQPQLGIWILLGALALLMPATSAMLAGIGLVLGLAVIAETIVLGSLTLPPRQIGWAIVVGSASGLATVVIDILGPDTRVALPDSFRAIYLPLSAVLVTAALSVLLWRQFAKFSLRIQIALTTVATATLAMLAVGYFSFTRNSQTQVFLGDQLEDAVKLQAEAELRNLLHQEARNINDLFVDVNTTVSTTARYAANLLERRTTLSSNPYWDAALELSPLSGGSMDNPNTEAASVFVPAGVALTPGRIAELNTLAFLDFIGPDSLRHSSNIVALYYVDPAGATIYYPNIDLANVVPPDFQPAEGIWFTVAAPDNNPDRESVWTPPYQDPALTGLIVTHSTPIYDSKGEFLGVISADVQLAKISQHVSGITIGETGYAFLVDSAGRLLAMSESGYQNFNIVPEEVPINETPKQTVLTSGPADLRLVFQAMMVGSSSLARVTLNGEDSHIAYTPLESTGYSLGIIVPTRELNARYIQAAARVEAESQTTANYGLLLFIGVLVAVGLASAGLGTWLTSPLEQLTQAAQKVGAGDLSVRAPVANTDDLGTLARAFNSMVAQLRQFVGSLEQHVADRTRELGLAATVGRSISQVRSLDRLLADAVELIRSQFDLYYAQIYLTDPAEQSLILRAGAGAVGAELVRRGFRLPVGPGSINGSAAAEHRAIIVADTSTNPLFRPNSLLPDTRSEMAVPLILGDRVVGVLDVQSSQAGAFSEEKLPAFETLAGQLAVAIDNAFLFAQTERSQAELEEQTRRLTRSGWQDFLNAINTKERIAHTYESAASQPAGDSLASPVTSTLSAPIAISGEPVGLLRLEGESNRAWTESESELVNSVAGQVARQIENIRLLAQAEQYRTAAEEAARRLTREGWADYAEVLSETAYVYDGEQVMTAEPAASVNEAAHSRPLIVQGDAIGEISIEGAVSDPAASAAILESVAAQLSAHLENLRLNHQTQVALADTQLLYETSARLNAANSLEETLNIAAGPGIAAGASDALLFVFDLDSSGKPEWMEVRANWAGETAIALPVGVRFYIPSYPLARLFVNKPDEIALIDDIARDPRVDSRLRGIFEQTQLKAVAAMPLTIGGRWVGLIIVNWTAAHKFNPGDSQLYKSLTTQAAIVVDNRILFDQTQAALAESRQLYDASRRLAASVTLQEILATLVESVPITTVNRAVLMSYERGASGNFTGALVAANWHSGQGAPPAEIGAFYPADTFKTLKLFLNTDPAFFDDVQNDPRVEAPTRAVFAQQNVRGAALLPLWVTGRQLGIVLIQCEEPHHFDEPEIRPYTSLAQQLAIAVENRRLFEQTQVALSETQTLYNVSAQLNAATTVHEILFAVVQAVVGSEVTSAVLRSYEQDELGQPLTQILKAAWASHPEAPILKAPLGSALSIADYPFAGLIAESNAPVLCNDIINDPRVDPASRDSLEALGVRAAAFLPLVYGGQRLGYVRLTWDQPREFAPSETRLFGALAVQAAVAINNRLLFEQARKRAERESIINVINQKIQSATSVESAIQTAVRELGQIFKAKRAVVELTTAPERNNGH